MFSDKKRKILREGFGREIKKLSSMSELSFLSLNFL